MLRSMRRAPQRRWRDRTNLPDSDCAPEVGRGSSSLVSLCWLDGRRRASENLPERVVSVMHDSVRKAASDVLSLRRMPAGDVGNALWQTCIERHTHSVDWMADCGPARDSGVSLPARSIGWAVLVGLAQVVAESPRYELISRYSQRTIISSIASAMATANLAVARR